MCMFRASTIVTYPTMTTLQVIQINYVNEIVSPIDNRIKYICLAFGYVDRNSNNVTIA